jgi:hypothetical protein
MGTDIKSYAIDEIGNVVSGGNWADSKDNCPSYGIGEGKPFGWRNYAVFGFLADVRNYSAVTPISQPRGLPTDLRGLEDEFDYGHSHSWLSVDELVAFDYDALTEDRRGMRMAPGGFMSGAETCDIGEGQAMTYREFLRPAFFHDIAELQRIGADRVVFCFNC